LYDFFLNAVAALVTMRLRLVPVPILVRSELPALL